MSRYSSVGQERSCARYFNGSEVEASLMEVMLLRAQVLLFRNEPVGQG